MGLDEWLVKVSWLGKLVSVFWWVELDLFSLECPVVSFEMGLWVWCEFGQPVYQCSGLCSCIAGELAWYVLLWNWLALGWSLVSV